MLCPDGNGLRKNTVMSNINRAHTICNSPAFRDTCAAVENVLKKVCCLKAEEVEGL